MGGSCGTYGKVEKCKQCFVGKSEDRRPRGWFMRMLVYY